MTATQLVNYVEELCDLLENLDNEIVENFVIFGKKISVPATVAAARVYFYIENKDMVYGHRKMLYDSFHFLVTDPKCKWQQMTPLEKIAIFLKTEISTLFIFV